MNIVRITWLVNLSILIIVVVIYLMIALEESDSSTLKHPHNALNNSMNNSYINVTGLSFESIFNGSHFTADKDVIRRWMEEKLKEPLMPQNAETTTENTVKNNQSYSSFGTSRIIIAVWCFIVLIGYFLISIRGRNPRASQQNSSTYSNDGIEMQSREQVLEEVNVEQAIPEPHVPEPPIPEPHVLEPPIPEPNLPEPPDPERNNSRLAYSFRSVYSDSRHL